MEGTVKFFHDKKGYGFIENDDLEDDVFFHISEVDGEDELEEGTDVTFETEEGDRGPEAVDVERA
ncbi:MAG: cold shock domain-containing protein [Candidatus Nanosalina sp.]